MSGKTSAEIAKGDVPAVGEYTIMYRIPKTATKGTRATWTPAALSLKENARINIKTNIGINPRRRRVARPMTSSNQKAGAPKLFVVCLSAVDLFKGSKRRSTAISYRKLQSPMPKPTHAAERGGALTPFRSVVDKNAVRSSDISFNI
jgi:hypothetical protein